MSVQIHGVGVDHQTATFIVAASDSLHPEQADYVCDGVDDQVEINTAITGLPSFGGKLTILPGNYNQSGDIIAISDIEIELLGKLKTSDGYKINNIIIEDCDNVYIHGGVIDGNVDNVPSSEPPNADSPYNQNGILVAGSTNTILEHISLKDCVYHGIFGTLSAETSDPVSDLDILHCNVRTSLYDGTRMAGGGRVHVLGGNYISNGQFAHYWDGVSNSSICNTVSALADILGVKSSIKLNNSTHTRLSENEIYGSDYGVWVSGIGSVSITNNNIHTNRLMGIYCTSDNTTISNNYIHDNTEYGIKLYETSWCNIIGNDFYQNVKSGFWLHVSTYNNVSGNKMINNSNGASSDYHGLWIYDSNYNVVKNNYSTDTRAGGSKTQKSGIEESGTANYNQIHDNYVFDNLTNNIKILGANTKVLRNVGITSEASGTDTVPAGAQFKVVTHGLGVTPVAGDIMVTPLGSLLTATEFWIDTYTSTTFKINVDANPGGAGVLFAWKAIVL